MIIRAQKQNKYCNKKRCGMLTNVLYIMHKNREKKTSPSCLYIQSPISIALRWQQGMVKERSPG